MSSWFLQLCKFKESFIDSAIVLLFTFIVYGFNPENLLWYLGSVVVITPIAYGLNKHLFKPFAATFRKQEQQQTQGNQKPC